MVSNLQSRWIAAGITFVVWALLAASAVYWSLNLSRGAESGMVPVTVRAPAPADPVAVARLLGYSQAAAPQAASLASRFALTGVVASRERDGAALIAVDGRPAKPFRVGATVTESLVLQSVEPRRAVLAASKDGPPAVTLELPTKR
jgi:general secretion pathway protein C